MAKKIKPIINNIDNYIKEKETKNMKRKHVKFSKNQNKETNDLFVAQKGFSFTLEPRNEKITGLSDGFRCTSPGYLVIGHQCNDNEYYIECYQSFPETAIKLFEFSAVITEEGGYDALVGYVLNFLNTHSEFCGTASITVS